MKIIKKQLKIPKNFGEKLQMSYSGIKNGIKFWIHQIPPSIVGLKAEKRIFVIMLLIDGLRMMSIKIGLLTFMKIPLKESAKQ